MKTMESLKPLKNTVPPLTLSIEISGVDNKGYITKTLQAYNLNMLTRTLDVIDF